jgi:hypothetical protein
MNRQWMFFFFDRQRKMNQKESSQPGSVAMKALWLGRACDYRNITNAALKTAI